MAAEDIDGFEDSITVESAAERIKSMDIRGAGRIARAVVKAIRNGIIAGDFNSRGELHKQVIEWARVLYNTRPTAVSLANALRYVIMSMDDIFASNDDIGEIKKCLVDKCNEFIERSYMAIKTIGEYGAHRLRDGMSVLTHCNSTSAISVILTAIRMGKNLRVYATESRPRHQGYITARTLAENNVDVTLIIDSAVRATMRDVDIVIVGADTITANGAVINKIGTSQVALCAHEARVPVIVAAETYKFSPETLFGYLIEIEERSADEVIDPKKLPGVKIRNPAFDATPPEYIDAIVTEVGIIPPSAAYDIIVTYYGRARPMNELLQ